MEHGLGSRPIRRIAMIGNYVPRQCGIATFTADMVEAIAAEYPDVDCFAVAMNDIEVGYRYPKEVRFEIPDKELSAYRRAADFLNINNVDLVCVQHEYGIFGGKAGSHLLALLRELRMPIVTTLHTVLREPNENQREVMDELVELSQKLVVMSEKGIEFMLDVHNVPPSKLALIHHGIPDIPLDKSDFYKDHLGVDGDNVLLTFGLLGPDKGIENVIKALPAILKEHPNTVYLIVGATHPHIRQHHGEVYRQSLEHIAQDLGVDGNVIFHNRFVSLQELTEFIGAADIYITPYLKPEQITSGTLAYAVGSGKAVISTPYWYAEELLAEDRGILVPWRSPEAIAESVLALLSNEERRSYIQANAYDFGRQMVWPAVARQYMGVFEEAAEATILSARAFQAKRLATRPIELPEINLTHLRLMTDDTGLLQHALYSVPNYNEGYCVDDNARALMLTALLEEHGFEDQRTLRTLASHYLAFINHAYNEDLGRFRNFMSYERHWLEIEGSEDSHARALGALGTVVGRSWNTGTQGLAKRLFDQALPAVVEFTSPRAWAFAILAVDEYSRSFMGDSRIREIQAQLAERLLNLYRNNATPEWPWFEDSVTYANGRISQAMMVAGQWLSNSEMLQVGLQTLEWLTNLQRTEDGHFAPIGSNGFYVKGGQKAEFDQQPIEAWAMVSACLDARRITGDEKWSKEAKRAYQWFLGQNMLHEPLYDPITGGCKDGLHPDRVNENQGAESTLAFLLSTLEMRLADNPSSAKASAIVLSS